MRRSLLLFICLALLCAAGTAPAWAEEAYYPGTQRCQKPHCFWCTPMDISDTAALAAMLAAPITVIDGHQKEQEYLLAQPDDNAPPVGEVTCESQGLHVLQTLDNGWSLVECYSSSFAGSKIKAWNSLVQGYVPTKLLKEKKADAQYGLIVDKLTQRLYIFVDGKLYDTLYASTGLPNDRQPYNETRSGEFILVSPTGFIKSDNLIGNLAMRFNAGDMIHEVPYIERAGGAKNYEIAEKKLGQRASHGCIRIQRKRTPLSTNMTWVWNTLKGRMGTRIVIWEDVPGRQIPIPAADTPIYYNPAGGKYYHAAPTCFGASRVQGPMPSFAYSQLDNAEFAKLKPCDYCVPPLRQADIEAINAAHRLP